MIHWKRFFPLLLITAAWLMPVAPLSAGEINGNSHAAALQQLTQEMLANNQALKALGKKVVALKEEVQAAGALDDPRLGFGLLNLPTDSFRFDEQPMTQKQIAIAQRIPWFGKLDLKTQRATLNAARMESMLHARRLTLMRDLADAYYELGFVAASIEINLRMTDHLDQIVRVAETRYAAGKGLQQDVLQAQVEQSRLMDQHNMLERQRRTLEDRINGLLNRPAYSAIEPPTPVGLPDLWASVEQWQAKALEANPDLQTRRIEIEQAKVDVELSRKAYYPDPDLRLAYGQRDPDTDGNERPDFFSASIVFSLPVWAKRKQDRRQDAAAARRQAAQSDYQDLVARLPHQVDAVAAELDQLRENYILFKEAILIQAAQWAESSRFSYEVGKVNFNTMVSAQLHELKLERQAIQYLFQYYRKMASLDRLLGGRLHEPTTAGIKHLESGASQQASIQTPQKEARP